MLDVKTATREQRNGVWQRVNERSNAERELAESLPARGWKNGDVEATRRFSLEVLQLDRMREADRRDYEWVRKWDDAAWMKGRGFPPDWSR